MMRILANQAFRAKTLGLCALAILSGGAFTNVSAQTQSQACLLSTTSLTTWTNCPNQTIPRDATNPYQMSPNTKLRKVLLYDIGSHANGKQAWRRALITMAYRYGFELVISDAALGYITATTLAGVDLVVFSQGDGDRVPSTESATALKNFIYRDGKSMMMVHAAAAFITCGGTGTGGGGANIDNDDASCRFMARAAARQYYHHVNPGTQVRVYADTVRAGQVPAHASLGATGGLGPVPPPAVMNHGLANDETKNIFNNNLAFNWKLPPNSPTDASTLAWDGWGDEWYDYYNNPGPRAIPAMTRVHDGVTYTESRLNIILSLDETSVNFGTNRMGDHPEVWSRKMGKGISVYNNIGHDYQPFYGPQGVGRPGGGRTGNDSVAFKFSWNLMRYLARDFVGCMNPAFAEYNPDATVTQLTDADPVNPCVTPVAIATPGKGVNAMPGLRVTARGFELPLTEAGFYRVHISDLKGRTLYAKAQMGGAGKSVKLSELAKGSYFVRVTNPQRQASVARVDI